MAGKWSLLLLVLVALDLASSQINHQSIHDQLPFSIQTIPLDNGVEREAGFQSIRITPYFVNDSIDASVPAEVFGPGGPLERALALLSHALSVRRLQGNLAFEPTVNCSNETDVCIDAGGSCSCNLAAAAVPSLMCAEVPIPDDHIGTAEMEICNTVSQQCETVGPNGAGLADTDFVLYVTALQTDLCNGNPNSYTYASACSVDPTGMPIAGYLNVCPQNIPVANLQELVRLFTREMVHVLGFSTKLFPYYGTTAIGVQVYKGVNQRAIVSSRVVDYAQSYYECDTLSGVFLEDSTSHWDTRILLPELMTRQFYPAYSILSGFTLALLEDSGWYQANYAVADQTVNNEPIPLLYGKGFGCSFVYDDCLNAQSFPYTCSPTGSSRDWCSFDGVYKAVCQEHPATDGCRIPMPDTTVNADCRSPTANIQDSSLELAGNQSLCFRSSFYTASTPNQPLSDPTASCYEVHPFFDGTNHRYAVETAADTAPTIFDVDYTCSFDGEGVNATSGSSVMGGALWCGYLCNVLGVHGDATVGSTDYCHSSCKSCLRGNDSTACTSCNDDSLVVAGDSAGPCQPPEGTVRLEDGPSADRGRVEVFTSGLWRSICVTTWDIVAANLVCAQLGYLRAEEAYLGQGGRFGQGSGPILEDLQCTGSETILQQCVFNVAADGNCSHSMDAAVMCTDTCSGTRSSSNGVYSVTYTVNGETISFTLQAQTTGWVGIGFSLDQLMPNTDVVVGAANSQGSFVYDGYSVGRFPGPTIDTSQDIASTSAVLMNGVTTVAFRRERVTGDPEDMSLDQCLYFLYAWGGAFNVTTQVIMFHGGNREASGTMICLPSASVCPATCIFGTYLQSGDCVVSCANDTIGDSATQQCRDVMASDVNSAGYTVNATRYEAALFVDESTNMVAEGTYLFTIGIIPVTLDINSVVEFIGAVIGTGRDNTAFQATQGASVEQVVVSALDPLRVGVYTFSIALIILDFDNPDQGVSHVAEAEVRILPPPQVCNPTICENNGTCSEIIINNQETFSCECTPGWTGLTCAEDIDECAPEPCQNGGSCINMQNAYMCVCPSNFMGVNCEEDRDECVAFAPCENGGTCNNTFGDYVCMCPDNWMGKDCTEDVDECLNNPCQNSGSCENSIGNYSCMCTDQWTGRNCDIDVDECLSEPCQNGGTCNNTVGDYECVCLETWMGQDCEEDVDECTTSDPCVNGDCTNTDGGYNCTCEVGWTGMICDEDIDECELFPCQNGGNCTNLQGLYNCSCPETWTGMDCDEDVNECFSDPCMNGGTCNNTDGSYNCMCTAQWTGTNCGVDVDECLLDPCQNGGTCNNTDGTYSCACPDGWTGVNCEVDIDECFSDPCMNGGTCNNTDGSYNCLCTARWTGTNCGVDVDECLQDPCQNGGTCNNTDGTYSCACPDGWTGVNCEVDVDDCFSDPCMNGGTCNNTDGGYNCLCTAQWTGTNCEVDVDECLQDPCQNGGTCNNTNGDYECLCLEPWMGKDCDEDVDECTTSDPCVNGDCTNTAGGYSCTCDSGWTGMNCDEDIDECDFFPCQNGGACSNTMGSYFCNCTRAWMGSDCQTDVNECLTDPCENGECVNIPGNFVCLCYEGWTDTLCDVDVNECNFSSPPCLNNGTCSNTEGGFNCTCLSGFSGPTCSEDIRDPCSEMPCQNGNCTRLSGTSYVCMCDPDYTGMLECTVIDNCRNVSCGNGRCVDGVQAYMCDCDEGFEGANCEFNINDCEPNPCQQNAACIDLINDYMCNCPDGYSGKDCEADINLCDPNPCENQGTCNGTLSYTCECVEPFIGPNCSERLDLCEPGICEPNGNCTSDGFSYTCTCYGGYYGDNCEFFDLCTLEPCQNEGTCTTLNDTMGYICDCPFPFSGPNCTTIVDACVALEPCVNGNCSSTGPGTYSCDCNPGWTGMNCDVDIMDCAMSPCVNGECMDIPGSYNCSCYQGWEGRHCDEDIDYCLPSHMCQNNATCVDGNSTYTCNCSLVDYEGSFCDVLINDCMPSPCLNNGTCHDAVRDYVCFCLDEYIGDDCNTFAGDCVEVAACQNGGTCEANNGRNECVCPPGLRGYFCNEDINECSSNPCNSGTCNNTFGSFFCTCPAGYAGMLCTIRNCDGNPCQNGQCMLDEAENTNFTCICDSGYTGNLCEVDINECLGDPCGVGNCTNMPGSFVCDCPPYRTGSVCETEVDFCANVDCGNGVCMNQSDSYICVCILGYTGANCGSNIDDCLGVNCSGNGDCIDLIDGFQCMCNLGFTGPLCANTYTTCASNPCNATGTATCTDDQVNELFTCNCQAGYTGTLCDTLISHCAMMQNPCLNNGTCQDVVNGFICDCVAGFSGNRCQFNIDECASEPCQNGGTCEDGINSFTCFCTEAWDGPTCEIYVFSGLCAAISPCANGGSCIDTVDFYECDCVGDYTGENCTVRIDHCEQNPCQANATCVDGVQTYVCLCPPGYTGRDCDELRGTPTNCTADSDCGFGFFCQRSCPTDSYPQHDTLLKEPLTLVGESSLFVPINRYPTVMVNFTLIARFRQDPNNAGYIFFYSSDAVTHTFGVLLNASSSQVKVLYQSSSNPGSVLATIVSQYRWDDNAYHTLAVAVNDAGNGMFDVVVIMDGFYLGYEILAIDLFHRVGTDDPVLIVGSRLPLPGNFRFVGRIFQVALFESALTREEIVDLMDIFNHLRGVVGTCIPHLSEGDRCPIPVTAASSLCDTTTERCNPAERCLPNVLGEFECRNAPIECESDADCDAALLGPAFCGGFEFPRYGQNFYERSDSRIAGMLQYLQREPLEFDYNTQPRFIPSNEYPDVTKDLTIFALVQQELNNNGYVVAKGSSSSNRDYGLYLASRDNFVALLYRTVNGTFHRFVFHNIAVAGMGPSTVAAIVDSERGRAELFINGTSVGRRRLDIEPQLQPQLHLLAVGGRPDNLDYNFRGTISDLLVTNVALPYDVIQSMSSASLTGQFQPSTVSRYCFMRAETGRYCHANSRADNNFQCVANAACVVGPSAPQPPTLPQPFAQFGPIGFCQ